MNTQTIKERVGKSVRIATELMNEAETAAQIHQRSLSAQVEHWARIGAAIDGSLNTYDIAKIKTAKSDEQIYSVLASIITGRGAQSTLRDINSSGGLIFEEHPTQPGVIVRIDNGRRQAGRFRDGTFDFMPMDAGIPTKSPAGARREEAKTPNHHRRRTETSSG